LPTKDRKKEALIEEICERMRAAGRIPEPDVLRTFPLFHLEAIHAHWTEPKYVC
jgi:hypothetical protein